MHPGGAQLIDSSQHQQEHIFATVVGALRDESTSVRRTASQLMVKMYRLDPFLERNVEVTLELAERIGDDPNERANVAFLIDHALAFSTLKCFAAPPQKDTLFLELGDLWFGAVSNVGDSQSQSQPMSPAASSSATSAVTDIFRRRTQQLIDTVFLYDERHHLDSLVGETHELYRHWLPELIKVTRPLLVFLLVNTMRD